MTPIPARARLFVAATVACAAAGMVITLPSRPPWSTITVLAVAFWMLSSLATEASSAVHVSPSFVVGVAAVLLTGPFGAALVGLAYLLQYRRGGSQLIKRVFNGAQFALLGLIAGEMYAAGFGGPRLLDGGNVGVLLVAALIVGFIYWVGNTVLISVVVSLSEAVSPVAVWWRSLSWSVVAYLAYGLLGLFMAVLWHQTPGAGLLVLVPLLVARWAFAQYSQQQAAYDATVRSLVQAVETKDYYTRGHSERVARATVMVAREWGMREDRVATIRYAGMLHDVGKLGVPTKVLQKQGKLSGDEYDAIKLHPVRGFEMLREIDFLSEALAGIVHHHERMDGRGYPMGLVGENIPEFARIISVADAFDSMTSTRSYRGAKTVAEAIAELRRCEGPQFDPRAVDALVRAVDKHGWEPNPEPFHGELVSRDGSLLPPPDAGVIDDHEHVPSDHASAGRP